MLCENGFNSPKIIAVAEKRNRLFFKENILITEEIQNAKCFYDWEKEWNDKSNCPVEIKREFVRQLGRTIGKLHAKNISHGDLRPGNIYAGHNDKDKWSFYFLDNERTRKFTSLPVKLRIKNLVQINIVARFPFTYTDRIRFYREYIKENPSLQADAKTLMMEVVEITRQRMKKIFAKKQDQI